MKLKVIIILILIAYSSISSSKTISKKKKKQHEVKKTRVKYEGFKWSEEESMELFPEDETLKPRKGYYFKSEQRKSGNNIIDNRVVYETKEELKEKWNLHKGVEANYGKSTAMYDKEYRGNIESYAGKIYIKAVNDDGYFVKWNTGLNYLKGQVYLGEYDAYSFSSGPGVGIEKNYYGIDLMSGIDMNLQYLPGMNYESKTEYNPYNSVVEDSMVIKLTPKLRADKKIYFNRFSLSTFGQAGVDFNKYISGEEPDVEIEDPEISQGILERGFNLKGGVDIEYLDMVLGVEVNHFTGKYNEEKTRGSVRASYTF